MASIISAAEFETKRARVSLDGSWQFSYDPKGVGTKQRWFAASHRLPERITVPGCSQARSYHCARIRAKEFGGLPGELGEISGSRRVRR